MLGRKMKLKAPFSIPKFHIYTLYNTTSLIFKLSKKGHQNQWSALTDAPKQNYHLSTTLFLTVQKIDIFAQ